MTRLLELWCKDLRVVVAWCIGPTPYKWFSSSLIRGIVSQAEGSSLQGTLSYMGRYMHESMLWITAELVRVWKLIKEVKTFWRRKRQTSVEEVKFTDFKQADAAIRTLCSWLTKPWWGKRCLSHKKSLYREKVLGKVREFEGTSKSMV